MLLKKKAKAIIFDMDGILVDTEPFYYDVNAKLYNSLVIKLSPSMFASLRAISSSLKWTKLKADFSFNQSVEELMTASKMTRYNLLKDKCIELIEGIRSLQQELSQANIHIGLASSASRLIADLLLKQNAHP